jgi:hypothetical protein
VAVASAGAVVYAGGNGVARSDDDGLTFHLLAGSPTSVSALQVLSNGDVFAQAGSNVYRSRDQGATWQMLSRGFALPVVVDGSGHFLAPRLVVSGLLEIDSSTDEGDTWQSLTSTGLPYVAYGAPTDLMGADGAGRLYMILPGPVDNPQYGRPLEIYASADGGLTWGLLPEPIPNPQVTLFATDKQGRLLAGTAGGVFRFESAANPGPAAP